MLYSLIIMPLVAALLRLVAIFSRSVQSGLRERRGWQEKIKKSLAGLDRKKKLIWFHCPSLGEFEQARPLITELRCRRDSELNIVLSLFSESGLRYGRYHGLVDYAFLLPLDGRQNVRKLLREIRPDLLCFVKSDLWPEIAWTARENGVPVALVSAGGHGDSSLTQPLLRGFFRMVFQSCNFIGAIAETDALVLSRAAGRPVPITGDSKYDAVLSRRDAAGDAPLSLPADSVVLVCGSTHPADERYLLSLFPKLLKRFPRLRIVLAPHHVDEQHLLSIEQDIASSQISFQRLSQLSDKGTTADQLVLVDTMGQLFELYAGADLAYVGGGFHDKGLHNILEPACFGAAVVVGPRIVNSVEAQEMVRLGCAEQAKEVDDLNSILEQLIADSALRQRKGRRARDFCEDRAGASVRITKELLNLLQ